MKLSEQKELKLAILAMPEKEKNKLLLRLIAKDKVLTEQLHFMLLEDESDLQERINILKEGFQELAQRIKNQPKLNNVDVILFIIRSEIAKINNFYKIVKSEVDEVALKLEVLNLFWYSTNNSLKTYCISTEVNEYKLGSYLIKAINSLWKKYQKLHEDYQFDLKDEMDKLLEKVDKARYMKDFMYDAKFPRTLN